MIIVNAIIYFCILVLKGIALFLYGFFSIMRTIFSGVDKLFELFYRGFEKLITLLWSAFFFIIELVCYLIFYLIRGLSYIFGGIFGVGDFVFIKALKKFWRYFFRIFTFSIEQLLAIGYYGYLGVLEIGYIFYQIGLYLGKGVLEFSIILYNGLMILPRGVLKIFGKVADGSKKVAKGIIVKPMQETSIYSKREHIPLGTRLKNLPKNIKVGILEWYNGLNFVKHSRNKRDMDREVLLIDFNSQDAKRSDKKIVWQYYAKDENGKYVRGIFEAFSKLDVHSFLMSEGYTVYEIKTSNSIEFFHGGRNSSSKRVKAKPMIFFLTQLSTYIKAGIPLTDSVRILSKQEKNKKMQRLYQAIIYELIMGENFSKALERQGEAFPKLLVNMLKTSEMTGELAETLDDMAEYYSTSYKLRKQTITSMMYPMIVLFFVVVVITFIMIYVVPQFVEIYKNSNADLPAITVVTIAISEFLQNYVVYLIFGIIGFIFLVRFFFKRVKMFKTMVQWTIMHIPVIKNIIIYNEITMFTKTFSALLQHNVFITDSMEILSKITNNEIYKMIVFDAIANIARGDNISSSFKNHWAIPSLAYEMMVTGERTGQLPVMMGKVAVYYQEEQKNLVNQIKVLIEPIVIVFLSGAVGLILLAVVIPMFNLYSSISSGV